MLLDRFDCLNSRRPKPYSAFLLMAISLIVASSPARAEMPAKATRCEAILTGIISPVVAALALSAIPRLNALIDMDLGHVPDISGTTYPTLESVLAEHAKIKLPPYGETMQPLSHFQVIPYGGAIGLRRTHTGIAEMKAHFQNHLPTTEAKAASDIIDTFQNLQQIEKWIKSVNVDVLTTMWKAGYNTSGAYNDSILRETFLDDVLSRRAIANGLATDDGGHPAYITTASRRFFYRLLFKKTIFMDWLGHELSAPQTGDNHYIRGHMLQMVYAAEHIPNFDQLLVHVGQSHDEFGVWAYLFDNPISTRSAFWTGRWIGAYKSTLRIRY